MKEVLLKYTLIINSLLTQLKSSELSCKLFKSASVSVGYADDLAAAYLWRVTGEMTRKQCHESCFIDCDRLQDVVTQ